MPSDESFLPSLKLCFDERASSVSERLSMEELCYVSGRDPRLWKDEALRKDMIDSIREQLDVQPHHTLLEVGCAAGFLALDLSAICNEYTGIDLSPAAVSVARSLGIPNADFRVANATDLPFPNEAFDRVISYDVFTNFPRFEFAGKIMEQMVRVTKSGGKVMIGSVPDSAFEKEFEGVVRRVQKELEDRYGQVKEPVVTRSLPDRLRYWYMKKVHGIQPIVVCYYFDRNDFLRFGNSLGLETEILEIHQTNPYRGYRFNVVFTKLQ